MDEVVFFGLLNDLFPGRDPPRVVDDALQKSVDDMVAAMPDFVDDIMKLKTIQLDELLQIRHCVFVMGPPGAFKSTSWKYLAKAKRIVAGRDSFLTIKDINPKTMPTQDLYGYINMATRDWKDGLLSSILRDLSQIPDEDPKWLMLDGDLDAILGRLGEEVGAARGGAHRRAHARRRLWRRRPAAAGRRRRSRGGR